MPDGLVAWSVEVMVPWSAQKMVEWARTLLGAATWWMWLSRSSTERLSSGSRIQSELLCLVDKTVAQRGSSLAQSGVGLVWVTQTGSGGQSFPESSRVSEGFLRLANIRAAPLSFRLHDRHCICTTLGLARHDGSQIEVTSPVERKSQVHANHCHPTVAAQDEHARNCPSVMSTISCQSRIW
ncbi:uncharacterized protein BDW70DRAFT_22815 [Aspergillus foveolatus]|uniref:uncharacterized protein n=1 Tax=Aspergillus foveolatus TaxID=210207 RepID=UPI003CCCA37C